jgi:hypothetical protein
MALEIDDALLEGYGTGYTEKWLFFLETFNFGALAPYKVFMEIVTDPGFCVACADNEFCANCRFGIMTGECGHPTSLYQRFMAEIYRAWSKEEKE